MVALLQHRGHQGALVPSHREGWARRGASKLLCGREQSSARGLATRGAPHRAGPQAPGGQMLSWPGLGPQAPSPRRRAPQGTAGSTGHTRSSARGTTLRCC